MRDGTLESPALRVALHQQIFLCRTRLVGPRIEHEIIVPFLTIDQDPVRLDAWIIGIIHLDDRGLTGRDLRVDLCQRRVAGGAGNDGFESHLRVDLADRAPADPRAGKALYILKFLVEGLGGFGVSISAKEHGYTGEGATDITDRI